MTERWRSARPVGASEKSRHGHDRSRTPGRNTEDGVRPGQGREYRHKSERWGWMVLVMIVTTFAKGVSGEVYAGKLAEQVDVKPAMRGPRRPEYPNEREALWVESELATGERKPMGSHPWRASALHGGVHRVFAPASYTRATRSRLGASSRVGGLGTLGRRGHKRAVSAGRVFGNCLPPVCARSEQQPRMGRRDQEPDRRRDPCGARQVRQRIAA